MAVSSNGFRLSTFSLCLLLVGFLVGQYLLFDSYPNLIFEMPVEARLPGGLLTALLFAALVIPIAEELAFRWGLKRLSGKWKYIALLYVPSAFFYLGFSSPLPLWLLVMLAVLQIFLVVAIQFFDRFSHWSTFVLSGLIFVSVHVPFLIGDGELAGSTIVFFLLSILILATLTALLTLLRIKKGLIYAILLHSFWNGALILYSHFSPPQEIFRYNQDDGEMVLSVLSPTRQGMVGTGNNDSLVFYRPSKDLLSKIFEEPVVLSNGRGLNLKLTAYPKQGQVASTWVKEIFENYPEFPLVTTRQKVELASLVITDGPKGRERDKSIMATRKVGLTSIQFQECKLSRIIDKLDALDDAFQIALDYEGAQCFDMEFELPLDIEHVQKRLEEKGFSTKIETRVVEQLFATWDLERE